MSDQQTNAESVINRPLMDAHDDEYVLAGRLLGTQWVFPEKGAQQVEKAVYARQSEQGQTMHYPKIVITHGTSYAVSSFRWRIAGSSKDIEPANELAHQLVRVLETDD